MPDVPVPKAMRSKKKVKEFKRRLYHDTLYEVLRPVRQAQQAGGFWAVHKGV